MSLYRDYESKLLQGDAWRAPGTLKVTEELGGEKDVQVDRGRQEVLANFPDQGPVDALPYIGADRMLPQAVGESTAAYRERLRTAWDGADGWSRAGSHGSVLFALARAGFPTGLAAGAVIIQRTLRYSYLNAGVVTLGTHTAWTFDWRPPRFWNQFGIVFGADVAGLSTGSVLGKQLNALVRAWKPAKARFMGTWIITSGFLWGWPLGVTWGAGGRTWGGTSRFVSPG
jgi:hypothetical protein